MFKKLLSAIDELVFPPVCFACGNRQRGGTTSAICRTCIRNAVNSASEGRCRTCAAFLGPHIGNRSRCRNCAGRSFSFEKAIALTRYKPPVRNWIQTMKYQGKPLIGTTLGRSLGRVIRQNRIAPHIDAAVCVPLTPLRETRRGFNQAHMIARGISSVLGCSVLPDALVKTRRTRPQAQLSRSERIGNFEDTPFDPGRPDRIHEKTLLLVDDVMTTGATLNACGRALVEAGCKGVVAAVLAR